MVDLDGGLQNEELERPVDDMDTEDVIGDHGREEAIDVREALRRWGVLGMSSDRRYIGETDGLRDDDLVVAARSSSSTLVELFHAGLFKVLPPMPELSSLLVDGDDSGVRLWLYL